MAISFAVGYGGRIISGAGGWREGELTSGRQSLRSLGSFFTRATRTLRVNHKVQTTDGEDLLTVDEIPSLGRTDDRQTLQNGVNLSTPFLGVGSSQATQEGFDARPRSIGKANEFFYVRKTMQHRMRG